MESIFSGGRRSLKRNAAILAAKREYHATLKEIAALKRRLGIKPRGRPRKICQRLLDIEGHDRSESDTAGRQADDDGGTDARGPAPWLPSAGRSRAVAHAIRSGLQHYRRQFRRDTPGPVVVRRLQLLTSLEQFLLMLTRR